MFSQASGGCHACSSFHVRHFAEAANANDATALKEILAPDFVRHSQAMPDVQVRSADEFNQFNAASFATFPDGVATAQDMPRESE